MRILSFLPAFLLSSIVLMAQSPDLSQVKAALEDEGKKLYRSEMASWYGSDMFMEKAGGVKDDLRGYFSYDEGDFVKAVFFDENGNVLATVKFDTSFNEKNAVYDNRKREMTKFEKDLYALRQEALKIANSDTLFVVYKNTNLNLIPLLEPNKRRAYFLTGSARQGVVLFGNDYLLTFNEKNELLSKRMLHQNLIPVQYGKDTDADETKDGGVPFGTMHNHAGATGDFITATDICTLMLYARFTGWQQHIVVSENYMSIWNCISHSLIIVPSPKEK